MPNVELVILLVCSANRVRTRLAKSIRDGFNDCSVFIKEAGSVKQALRIVDNCQPDLVIADTELPRNSDTNIGLYGIELGYALNNKNFQVPVILLGNYELPEPPVRDAMLNGLIAGFRIAANMTPLLWRQLIFYSLNLIDDQPLFIGSSSAIRALKSELDVVIQYDMPVLLLGESGTGKTILAHYIHHNSQRAKEPFVSVNCAAIPQELIESELFGHVKGSYTGADNERKGLFQAADNGVLFLDEIGDMPLSLQPRLLRTIETGLVRPVGSDKELKVDVRVISATNKNIQQEIADGCFRRDLYYRLQNEELMIPPLRERQEDISELAEAIITRGCRKDGIVSHSVVLSSEVISQMRQHDWLGNIRELANVLEKAARRTSPDSPCITLLDLPEVSPISTARETSFNTKYQQLREQGMVNREIANQLGMSERQLYRLRNSPKEHKH